MTEHETAKVLAVIRAGLPNAFLKLSDADAKAMIALWAEMFMNYPSELVLAAAKTYIWRDTTGRFPTIGIIRELMEDIGRTIAQCSYGRSLYEYCGAAADRYLAAVQAYINDTAGETFEQRRLQMEQAKRILEEREIG